ncbi:MAG: GAF domain-containing sensor histidine kinase, partial [Anaerolinea sp.]|nr:GAF domain-containing sensor histidine kinase [Anaerolinea sp.]
DLLVDPDPEKFKFEIRGTPEEGHTKWIIRSGHPVIIPDVVQHERERDSAGNVTLEPYGFRPISINPHTRDGNPPYQAVVGLPIRDPNPIGVMWLHFHQSHPSCLGDRNIMTALRHLTDSTADIYLSRYQANRWQEAGIRVSALPILATPEATWESMIAVIAESMTVEKVSPAVLLRINHSAQVYHKVIRKTELDETPLTGSNEFPYDSRDWAAEPELRANDAVFSLRSTNAVEVGELRIYDAKLGFVSGNETASGDEAAAVQMFAVQVNAFVDKALAFYSEQKRREKLKNLHQLSSSLQNTNWNESSRTQVLDEIARQILEIGKLDADQVQLLHYSDEPERYLMNQGQRRRDELNANPEIVFDAVYSQWIMQTAGRIDIHDTSHPLDPPLDARVTTQWGSVVGVPLKVSTFDAVRVYGVLWLYYKHPRQPELETPDEELEVLEFFATIVTNAYINSRAMQQHLHALERLRRAIGSITHSQSKEDILRVARTAAQELVMPLGSPQPNEYISYIVQVQNERVQFCADPINDDDFLNLLRASRLDHKIAPNEGIPISEAQGVSGDVARSGTWKIINRGEAPYVALTDGYKHASQIAVAATLRNGERYVINVEIKEAHVFDEDDLKTLEALAAHITNVLEYKAGQASLLRLVEVSMMQTVSYHRFPNPIESIEQFFSEMKRYFDEMSGEVMQHAGLQSLFQNALSKVTHFSHQLFGVFALRELPSLDDEDVTTGSVPTLLADFFSPERIHENFAEILKSVRLDQPECYTGNARARIHPDWLKEVIYILLKNQAHAQQGDENARAELSVTADENYATITFLSYGKTPPPEVEHLLCKEVIPRRLRSENGESKGIGLKQAAVIIQSRGGSMIYDRLPDSRNGACFRIQLPLSVDDHSVLSEL